MQYMCRLVNKSGLRMTYWAVSDSGQGSAYALNAWEESPLMVEPVRKPVILADTQQQVGVSTEGSAAASTGMLLSDTQIVTNPVSGA